jgi:hypothetical protein
LHLGALSAEADSWFFSSGKTKTFKLFVATTISTGWFRFIKGALRSGPGFNNDEEMLEYPNSQFARTSVPYNRPHWFWNFARAWSQE